MATYTDTFTGTAGTALDTYNSTWVFIDGDGHDYYGIVGGTAAGTLFSGTSAKNVYRYNNTVGADQYVEIVIENIGSMFDGSNMCILVARADTGTTSSNHYQLRILDDAVNGASHGFELYKVVSGTPSILGSAFSGTLSNGDTVRLEVTGTTTTTFVTKINGTQIDSRSDSSSPHTSGQVGIGGAKTSGGRAASWGGGDLSSTTNYSLSTDAGNLTLNGQSVGFKLSAVAANGLINFNGQDVSFTHQTAGAYTLEIEPGTITFSAPEAYSALAVNIEHGTINFAGQDVTGTLAEPTNYSLSIDPGVINFNGRSVNLLWSGAPAGSGGRIQTGVGIGVGIGF